MTTPFLVGDTAGFEGLRLKAYPDPLSPRGRELAKPIAKRAVGWQTLPGNPWTIGYGATGPDIAEGTVWTLAQATARLIADLNAACADLDKRAPWWRRLNDVRQDVLAGLRFNLGWPKLSEFKHMLAALDAEDWNTAAAELLDSAAARELPSRYAWYADRLRTGLRPAA